MAPVLGIIRFELGATSLALAFGGCRPDTTSDVVPLLHHEASHTKRVTNKSPISTASCWRHALPGIAVQLDVQAF